MGGPEMAPQTPQLYVGGPDMAPHTPQRSERPGKPVALLDHAVSTRRNHELMSAISCAHTECAIGYSCHSTR